MDTSGQYREILELSQRMLTACRAQSWDELAQLEKERTALLARTEPLRRDGQAAAIAAMIRDILACDDEISERVGTWLSHVRILLRIQDSDATPQHP